MVGGLALFQQRYPGEQHKGENDRRHEGDG